MTEVIFYIGQLLAGNFKTKSFGKSQKIQSRKRKMKSSKIKSFDKVEIKLELCRLTKPMKMKYYFSLWRLETYPEWETFLPAQQALISGNVGRSSLLGVAGEDSPWRWVTTFTSYVGRLFPYLFSAHMETWQIFQENVIIIFIKIVLENVFVFWANK